MRRVSIATLVLVVAPLFGCRSGNERGPEHDADDRRARELDRAATEVERDLANGNADGARAIRIALERDALAAIPLPDDAWLEPGVITWPADRASALRAVFERFGGSAIDGELPRLVEIYADLEPADVPDATALRERCERVAPGSGAHIAYLADDVEARRGEIVAVARADRTGVFGGERSVLIVGARGALVGSSLAAYRWDGSEFREVGALHRYGDDGDRHVVADASGLGGALPVLGDRVVGHSDRFQWEGTGRALRETIRASSRDRDARLGVVEGVVARLDGGLARLPRPPAIASPTEVVGRPVTAWRAGKPIAALVVRAVDGDQVVIGPADGTPGPASFAQGDFLSDRFHAERPIELCRTELEEQLRADTPAQRIEAARALGALGCAAAPSVPALVAALRTHPEDGSEAIVVALGRIGVATAVPALLDVASAGQGESAIDALARIGVRAALPLVAALEAESPPRRAAAARALGVIAQPLRPQPWDTNRRRAREWRALRPAALALASRLRDPDPLVRVECARALGTVVADPEPVPEALVAALLDPSPAVRSAVATVLLDYGDTGVLALVGALADARAELRCAAASALGGAGGPGRDRAGIALASALADEEPLVRCTAAHALADLQIDPATCEPLRRLAAKGSTCERAAARAALARFRVPRPPHPPASPPVLLGTATLRIDPTEGVRDADLHLRGAAFSPDGARLAALDSVGRIYVWDVSSGRRTDGWSVHARAEWFSRPIGWVGASHVFALARKDAVGVWGIGPDRLDRELPMAHAPELAVTAGSWMVAATEGGRVMRCDLGSTTAPRELELPGTEQLALSAGGERFAALVQRAGATWLEVRRTVEGDLVRRIGGAMRGPVALSPDGTHVAGLGTDGRLRVWALDTGRPTGPLAERVSVLAFSSATRLVALRGNALVAIDLEGEPAVRVVDPDAGPIGGLALSPDGSVAALYGGRAVRLVDLATGRERFPGHDQTVGAVAFSPDGRTLYTTCRRLNAWDASDTGHLRWRRSLCDTGWFESAVTHLAVAPSGREVAVGDGGGVTRWSVPDGALVERRRGAILDLRYGAGDELAVLERRREPADEPPAGGATVVEIVPTLASATRSADGRLVAAPGAPGSRTIRLLEVPSGRERMALDVPGGGIDQLAFSPDARLAVLTLGRVDVWDTRTGERIHRLALPEAPGGEYRRARAAFSPDGRLLAVATRSAAVVVWDVVSGTPISHWYGFRATSVGFAPHGDRLAMGGANTTAWVVRVSQAEPVMDLEAAWTALADADARVAEHALAACGRGGETVAVWLAARLLADPPLDPNVVVELAAEDPVARRAASDALCAAGPAGARALAAAAERGAPEVRWRAAAWLAFAESRENARRRRAIAALERIATPTALRALETLAGGTVPPSDLSRFAAAALARAHARSMDKARGR